MQAEIRTALDLIEIPDQFPQNERKKGVGLGVVVFDVKNTFFLEDVEIECGYSSRTGQDKWFIGIEQKSLC